VDPATAIVAVLYAWLQRRRSAARRPVLNRRTGWDVLNGLAIFPLLLMMGSTFSDYLTKELIETNKVILFGAGAVALFAILEDPE
jgi:hypothetical protein